MKSISHWGIHEVQEAEPVTRLVIDKAENDAKHEAYMQQRREWTAKHPLRSK